MTDMTATPAGPWLRDPGPRRRDRRDRRAVERARSKRPSSAPWPAPWPASGTRVNSWAFLAALIATPVAIAVFGSILIIPPFAMVIGLPAYLLAGAPVFWILLAGCHRRGAPLLVGRFALAGLVANLFTPVCLALGWNLSGVFENGVIGLPQLLGGALFGLVFAPLTGAVFALFYRAMAPGLRRARPETTERPPGAAR